MFYKIYLINKTNYQHNMVLQYSKHTKNPIYKNVILSSLFYFIEMNKLSLKWINPLIHGVMNIIKFYMFDKILLYCNLVFLTQSTYQLKKKIVEIGRAHV